MLRYVVKKKIRYDFLGEEASRIIKNIEAIEANYLELRISYVNVILFFTKLVYPLFRVYIIQRMSSLPLEI
jgi:hypothetical protein